MTKTTITLLLFIAFLLGACSGSDTYRGKWKATDSNDTKLEITFREHEIFINDHGKISKFNYSQNSVNISGSIETYGIQLENGRSIKIHFPIGNDESKGVILDETDQPVYYIGRKKHINRQDIYSN